VIKGSLARRYARALMAIGQEQGIYERLGQELAMLAEAVRADESFRTVLKAPVISKDLRGRVVEEVAKALGFHEVMVRFLALLNAKRRLPYLEQIERAYQELMDEAAGRVRANVTSAAPLSAAAELTVQAALQKMTGKEVLMSVEVDAGLIGGIVTRVAGKLLDGSVITQLRLIEERLKAEGLS